MDKPWEDFETIQIKPRINQHLQYGITMNENGLFINRVFNLNIVRDVVDFLKMKQEFKHANYK